MIDIVKKTAAKIGQAPAMVVGIAKDAQDHAVGVHMIPAMWANEVDKVNGMKRIALYFYFASVREFFFTSEVWMSREGELAPGQAPEDHPNRGEGVMVLHVKDGLCVKASIFALERRGSLVTLGEPIMQGPNFTGRLTGLADLKGDHVEGLDRELKAKGEDFRRGMLDYLKRNLGARVWEPMDLETVDWQSCPFV